jgi:hypothetical protein
LNSKLKAGEGAECNGLFSDANARLVSSHSRAISSVNTGAAPYLFNICQDNSKCKPPGKFSKAGLPSCRIRIRVLCNSSGFDSLRLFTVLLGHWEGPEAADRPAKRSIGVTSEILNNTDDVLKAKSVSGPMFRMQGQCGYEKIFPFPS